MKKPRGIVQWGTIAGALIAIGGAFTYFGFGLTTPYVERAEFVEHNADFVELAGGLRTAIEGQKALTDEVRGNTRQGFINERRYWIGQEEDAIEDLAVDSDNRSAKRELKRARENIDRIDNLLTK